jgi:hypothetical protein
LGGLILLVFGLLLLAAARLNWLKIVGFNRRYWRPKRMEGPPSRLEVLNRWWGTFFLGGAGLAFLVGGILTVALGHP